MKALTFLFITVAFTQSGWTQGISKNGNTLDLQSKTITTAVPFLRITPDARSAGMGDAGIGSSPDANSFARNTASLVFSQKRIEVSATYTPWLRNLVSDIHHAYLSGYTKLSDRHVIGGSLRYFSMGNVTFTNQQGFVMSEFSPVEMEAVIGYAFKLSDKSALGINGKYIYSNMTNGTSLGMIGGKAGNSGAVDLSYSYTNQTLMLAGKHAVFSFGTNISNIGSKMAYTTDVGRDFIPTNLGLGTRFEISFDESNKLSGIVDFNKLLVPSSPVRNGVGQVVAGKDPDVGAMLGMIQSFYDAPGNVTLNANGSADIQKGSRLKEELNEINIGGGLEYSYEEFLTIRTGYFYQHLTKGDHKYFTFGAGGFYRGVGIDVSYLSSLKRTNPLNNTVLFSLRLSIAKKEKT